MSDKATFRGVILDVDGTLVDSNDAHAAAWVDAFKEAGHDVPYDKVRRLIGMGGDKLMPEVSGLQKETPEGQQIDQRRKEIFTERYLPKLQPTRGAHELVRHMHDSELKLVVASSASGEELEHLLAIPDVQQFIEEETSSDEAEESKPEPDIVQVALGHLGMDAGEVVMLGDTPYDIEAASKAGVAVIALRSGGWSDDDLKGAIAVYDDPADLLEEYDDSPLGPGPVGG